MDTVALRTGQLLAPDRSDRLDIRLDLGHAAVHSKFAKDLSVLSVLAKQA